MLQLAGLMQILKKEKVLPHSACKRINKLSSVNFPCSKVFKRRWLQEQIKGENNVFSRFSCGHLRAADVLGSVFSSLAPFLLLREREGGMMGNEAATCQLRFLHIHRFNR